ncbi:MAG TPA: undecaprenyl-diphosphate phosphatase [Candidatus Wallbacteria bacterium]|nr:undecaprenyl-diphosphate phosphatase [Candidatus Wallbacteria bacterium]
MEFYHAIVLGAIQGLGEFLPISSSAHLILVPEIMGWPDCGQTFDVSLHMGTLAAVVVYFRNDITRLLKAFFNTLKTRSIKTFDEKLCYYIILATIPGAIAGKLFEEVIETQVRNSPNLIAMFLIIMGALLMAADGYGKKSIKLEGVTLKSSFLIGLSQALALLPGFSRSGITMTSALAMGLNNEAAARFSFLLAIPITLGAGILKGVKIMKTGFGDIAPLHFAGGVVTSALVGYTAISFLLKYIQTRSFKPFAVYRFLFGAFVIIYFMLGGKR